MRWLKRVAPIVDFWILCRQNGEALVHITDHEGACHHVNHNARRDAELFLND
jgi:hypothetical protein